MCVLCAVKLELTYSNPNRAFKVSEVLEEVPMLVCTYTYEEEHLFMNAHIKV